MKEIYIYHHLGLGDHIMLNGLVRTIAESYDKVWLFSKPRNSKNVKRMYRDNNKIIITPLDDPGVRQFMNIFPMHKYLIIGHTPDFFRRVDDKANGKTFDKLFYDDSKIEFENKWDKFYIERDIEKEKDVYYNILGLDDNSEFMFMHEGDYKPITREIPENIRIIKPDNKEIGIFDYLYTIEKAYQVHVANSSFMNLIDCIQLRIDNLFYHEYSRPNINTSLKLPWKIIK